ncbi:MAG TPA: von Willebrand factor type A domain-containing protein [Steroidobacteraceae bacterium]|nr:von Willebrand factor type A domain-containing protein [Steroidobacteraceae bacterium]
MPWYTRRVLMGGAASVCIAVVGVAVVWNTLRVQPEVAALEPAATPAAPEPPAGPMSDSAPAASTAADSTAATAADDARLLSGPVAAEAKRDEDNARSAAEAAPAAPVGISKSDAGDGYANQATAPALLTAEAPPAAATEEVDEVVVTGARGAVRSSVDMKRDAVGVVDAISAEDIGEAEGLASISKPRGSPHKSMAPTAPATRNSRVAGLSAGILQAPAELPPPAETGGRDKFEQFEQNPIKRPQIEAERVSTFSADVDTSSYSFVRKQLDRGVLPQKDAVRVEEMINYFDYAWPAAESAERPFQPTVIVSDSPWGKGRKLIHIGIKGYELPARQRPDANLVMLIDVSGSMQDIDKLPLVKQSMKLLLGSLKPTDTVAIVVYAGAAGQVLPPTPVSDREKIAAALDSLTPGGSTAGAEGIALAYQLAEKNMRKEGVNRILLCTDGDFNVGIDSTNELKGFVERKREKGIFLSVLGFGQGNYRDELAQALAQNGNGVAAYIDTLNEAQKVLVQEAGASLFTIAKDVKLQVEFNPATVAEYRLVGYETRALKREDFNNDAVDAGDVGSGHTVTAIYEITPVGVDARMIGESRYDKPQPVATGSATEYGFLMIRYKLPKDSRSQVIKQPVNVESGKLPEAIQRDVQFSTAVAGFAQLLRGGKYTGPLGYEDVIRQGLAARGDDPYGYRNEFVQLVRKAQTARGM